jgi:hypothetical protein
MGRRQNDRHRGHPMSPRQECLDMLRVKASRARNRSVATLGRVPAMSALPAGLSQLATSALTRPNRNVRFSCAHVWPPTASTKIRMHAMHLKSRSLRSTLRSGATFATRTFWLERHPKPSSGPNLRRDPQPTRQISTTDSWRGHSTDFKSCALDSDPRDLVASPAAI